MGEAAAPQRSDLASADKTADPALPISHRDIIAAQRRVEGYVHRTALTRVTTLSEMTDTELWLKAENLQKTGSFKVRGAINALLRLPKDARERGVITVSAGNHGMALAYAARIAQAQATVVMPDTAVRGKVNAVEGYGGRAVLVHGGHLMEAMEEIRKEEGQIFIHPFENLDVMAGQGTVGLEIVEDLPDVEAVVVPVGGGGLLSGIAVAVKARNPQTLIIGVEPEGSTAVAQSLAAGRPVRLESFSSVADGLNAPWGGPNTLEVVRRLAERCVTVADRQILQTLAIILERAKLLVEPAGAAALAALLNERLPELKGKRVVAVLSGGNVDLTRLAEFVGVDR